MHASWKARLASEFQKPYFKQLVEFVEGERKTQTIFPPEGEVFTAFDLTPYDKANVVILGQDPYPGAGHAHGLSFSVKPGISPPASLNNIFKELAADVGFVRPRKNGFLKPWAEQGVFLLNTVLTVRSGTPNSHKGNGWETFTDAVIKALDERETPVVFVLWGRNAREKKALIDTSRHTVIESAHPSPMSADNGFFGSRPFSKVNEALVKIGLLPIHWQLPET